MKSIVSFIICGLGVLLLSGCANTLSVTYHSDPSGAVLYSGNQNFGYTPVTLQYPISEEDRKRGYSILSGTTVRWASGASANTSSLRADLSIGRNQQFTFVRPENYPGREADARFALELQKVSAMQRQAQAQQDQALWQLYGALQQQQRRAVSQIINCNSNAVGNTINTTCY